MVRSAISIGFTYQVNGIRLCHSLQNFLRQGVRQEIFPQVRLNFNRFGAKIDGKYGISYQLY